MLYQELIGMSVISVDNGSCWDRMIAVGTLISSVIVTVELFIHIVIRWNEGRDRKLRMVLELIKSIMYQKKFISQSLTNIWIRHLFSDPDEELLKYIDCIDAGGNRKLKCFKECFYGKRKLYAYSQPYMDYRDKRRVMELDVKIRMKSCKELITEINEYNKMESDYQSEIRKEVYSLIRCNLSRLATVIKENTDSSKGTVDFETLFGQIERQIVPEIQDKRNELESKCNRIEEILNGYLVSRCRGWRFIKNHIKNGGKFQ